MFRAVVSPKYDHDVLSHNGWSGGVERVRAANVIIPDFSVDHGGVDVGMTKEPLNLFDRHSVTEKDGGDSMPENVRCNPDGEGSP